MSEVIDFLLWRAFWPVAFWTAALTGLSIIAGIVTWRVIKRLSRTRTMQPGARPIWYVWIAAAMFVVPSLSTIAFATPFALERELAIFVRTEPPLAVSWAAGFGSRALRSAVGVTDEDVLIDVAWVQRQLDTADQASVGILSRAWRLVPRYLEAPYLRAAHRVLSDVGGGSPKITWRVLDQQVRAVLAASTEVAAAGLSLSLYAAAYRYLLFWWLTLAACHVATLGVFVALTKTSLAGGAERADYSKIFE